LSFQIVLSTKKSGNSWVPWNGIVLFEKNCRGYWSKLLFPNYMFVRLKGLYYSMRFLSWVFHKLEVPRPDNNPPKKISRRYSWKNVLFVAITGWQCLEIKKSSGLVTRTFSNFRVKIPGSSKISRYHYPDIFELPGNDTSKFLKIISWLDT